MRAAIGWAVLAAGLALAAADAQAACDPAGGAQEAAACLRQDWQDADRRLNAAYKALNQTLDGEPKTRLRDGQRAWLKQRDSQCGVSNKETDAGRWLDALLADESRTRCVLRLTGERAAELEAMRPGQPAADGMGAEAILDEVRARFTVRGETIHPDLIEDFVGWLSDGGQIIAAMNLLDAVGSNRYCCADDLTSHGGAIVTKDKGDGSGYRGYRFIGKAENGLLVVHAFSNGGGSGVFHNLVIFDAAIDKSFDDGGKIIPRLTLAIVRRVGLGDRPAIEAISLAGNAIAIKIGPQTRTITAARP